MFARIQYPFMKMTKVSKLEKKEVLKSGIWTVLLTDIKLW